MYTRLNMEICTPVVKLEMEGQKAAYLLLAPVQTSYVAKQVYKTIICSQPS